MPQLPSPELKAFLDALDSFGEKPPGDLPDGALDMAKQLGQSLRGYTPTENMSPGEKDVVSKQGGSSDVAVEFSKAATGHDSPSPGQKEFAHVQQQARELADTIGSLGSSE